MKSILLLIALAALAGCGGSTEPHRSTVIQWRLDARTCDARSVVIYLDGERVHSGPMQPGETFSLEVDAEIPHYAFVDGWDTLMTAYTLHTGQAHLQILACSS